MRCCNSPLDVWIRVYLFSLSDLWKDEENKLSLSLSLSLSVAGELKMAFLYQVGMHQEI
jgi:hypothetical protein